MMLVRTHVGPSKIHGLGLFATEAIPRGASIWVFTPGFDQAVSPAQFGSLPPIAREYLRWFGYVRPEDGHYILSGDSARFMNHLDFPNTGAPPGAAEPVTTVALRDIRAGEELTCNYFAFDAEAGKKLGRNTAS